MWPYPSRSVRLFVRGFPRGSTQRDMRRHFEKAVGPGDVLDVSVRGLCAIVRMRDEAAGERARRELHGQPFLGIPISVHRFRGIKIYVGGLPEYCAPEDLRPLFQEYGPVAECGVVKDYAFVHMDNEEDGKAAIEHLNGTELYGSSITVQRSVKDHKHYVNREQHSEQETLDERDTFADPHYEEPPVSYDQDYRFQSGQAAAYRNGDELEDNSYAEAYSAQSHSYGSKSYDSHNADYENRAAYDVGDDATASYSTQYSDSQSTHDRASVDVAYQSVSDRLALGHRKTSSRHSLYERVRLSPPSSSYEDERAGGKSYTRQADDSYCPPYKYVCRSPPHSSRDDFDRRGNRSSSRYTGRSESASRYTSRSESASRYRSESSSRYRSESSSRYRSESSSRYTGKSESSSRYTGRSESSSRYTGRSESASRHTGRSESSSHRRPYERNYLSPPHRSRENHRSHR
ncbi:RNA-binding protein 4-like [Anolis carolinensis]|uniref:RNA-binding protein 4-like n=1 Tax=Anolis carolinensis TaxID=28377 RepID=UPI0002C88C62|nr:PREDICTED: RNA-binding protein 4 [Anolis carolinensis]|eukprot:XP_008121847.1 PREDICTED: RNA-binding protein 4 [Anolis carolinensis]